MSLFEQEPRSEGDEKEGLADLFRYPSLEALLERKEALEAVRTRLEYTERDLERVIRQGPRDDVPRAQRALQAVSATLALLKELEQLKLSK
ncbi:MAG: hypothetical protein C4334_09325 [Pyrinomonas sp.]|uniref:hypothetical protein n=1 Tax=Pyrinomonas sp. TaxID=2080306 RepID=UPI00331F7A5F